MDLFERYIQAIRKYLPWTLSRARQDDIVAELRANFESQLEDREADLGRPLTEGEMIDWLKQLGAPMQVAGRYQPVQYLIGPTLFPMYLYVLRLALFWSLVVYTIVAIVTFWTPNAGSVMDWIVRAPGVLLNTGFWVTLVFVVLEYILAHHPETLPRMDGINVDWSPSKLPPLEPVHDNKPQTYVKAVAEVIFGWLFLIWLVLIPKYPFLWLGPGAYFLRTVPFTITPIVWTFFWVVAAVTLVRVLWNTIDLLSGSWRRQQRLKPIAHKVFGMICLGVLVAAPGQLYAVLRNPVQDAAQYGATLDGINLNIWRASVMFLGIAAVTMLWEIYQWIKVSRRP
ncbi:MAG TPA: hypothetical protein VF742_00775, partial [Terracidiphilus sp.]